MGKQPPRWLFHGKGMDAPEVEHILSKNYHDFGAAFENNRELMDRERQRLGALTLLTKRNNLKARNKDFEERLPIYMNGPVITKAISAKAYDNHYRLKRSRQDAPEHPFKLFERITPDLIDSREELYVSIAHAIWRTDRL